MSVDDDRGTGAARETGDSRRVDRPEDRDHLIHRALLLSYTSVVWGVLSGTWSITAGLLAGSLGVLSLGFNVLADVAGSVGLVWRFRTERSDPAAGHRAEARASVVVASALMVSALVIAVAATRALVEGTGPESKLSAELAAIVAVLVLAPLGWAKRRVGSSLRSNALRGDGTLSAIGAFLAALALAGLLANRYFGWWWADRVAALLAACVAAAEATRVLRTRPREFD